MGHQGQGRQHAGCTSCSAGPAATGVTVYGHANGTDIDDTIDEALKYKAMGYKAIRLQTGVPGLASTYGVSKDKLFYEPADSAMPSENVWSTANT
jgi:mannonate dehydratase